MVFELFCTWLVGEGYRTVMRTAVVCVRLVGEGYRTVLCARLLFVSISWEMFIVLCYACGAGG